MKTIHRARAGALLLLCGTILATSQIAFAQDEEDTRGHQKLAAIARVESMVMVPMRDGVKLATDVYLPREGEGPWPAIFVKTPYNFNRIGGIQLEWAIEAIERGY
ncbi:MAG TPA: CocE/NonD family hydrolase, partial [Woeseiaceae bacterium]